MLWGIWNSEWELSFLARKLLNDNSGSATNLLWEQTSCFFALKAGLFLYKVKLSVLYGYYEHEISVLADLPWVLTHRKLLFITHKKLVCNFIV